MAPFSKGFLAQRLSGLTARVRHAFAVEPEGQPLSPEDVALLERVAATVVERGMAMPAILFLESVGPMSFLGSQACTSSLRSSEGSSPHLQLSGLPRLLSRRAPL